MRVLSLQFSFDVSPREKRARHDLESLDPGSIYRIQLNSICLIMGIVNLSLKVFHATQPETSRPIQGIIS